MIKFKEINPIKIYECKLNENDFWTLESYDYSPHVRGITTLYVSLSLDLKLDEDWCEDFIFDCENESIILHVNVEYDSLELISKVENLLTGYLKKVKENE